MAYSENYLNNYETYTYNIKISMVNPTNYSQEIFIAQNSADASLNISSVTHTHTLGQSLVRNSFANNFDIVISEPNNVRFFEKIIKSAVALGIKNHINATYKIEISFPGRLSTGEPKKYPQSTPLTYFVKFLSVDANINGLGAEYTIHAVETSAKGYYYINNDVKYSATYKASNVNEAISEFEKVLNEASAIVNETNLNSLNPDIYKIELAADTEPWGYWEFPIEDGNPSVVGDKLVFNITHGTRITDHIDAILKSTAEYTSYQRASGGAALQPGQEVSDPGSISLKYGFKVIPQLKDLSFDPLRGDYTKEITFFIKKHIIPETIIDSSELQLSASDRSYQLALLKEFFDTGLLTKKYDYLYTGKNTEVINFDLKLQFSYYMISPVFGGQITHSNLRNADELSTQVKSARTAKSKYIQARNSVQSENNASPARRDRLEQRADEALDEYTQLATELWENAQNTPVPSFQSDVIPDGNSYVPENEQQAVALLRFGAVQTNLESSADLVEIELGIRGDPYWLGNPTGNEDFSEDVAPFSIGGPMFFLNINLPVAEDENGLRLPSNEYYMSGVYRVINVISEFRNGQFIQYLKAIRVVKLMTDIVYDSLQEGEVRGPTASLESSITYEDEDIDVVAGSTGGSRSSGGSRSPGPAPTVVPSRRNDGTVQDPAVPEERQTTQVNVGVQATQRDGIAELATTNLIGIYGKPPNRRALIRYPSGQYARDVVVGDTINGSRITTISEDTITFETGRTLQLP